MEPNNATSLPDFAAIYGLTASFSDAAEEFERIIRRVYEALLKPGDNAIDIGAHTGKHSAPLALSVTPGGTVVALEPIPWAFERLEERAERANLTALDARRLCVGAVAQESVTFMIVPSRPGWSAKIARPGAEVAEISVAQTTVDSIAEELGAVRFLKIDVEGAEPEVIIGAREMLESARPVVHIEVSPDAIAASGHELSLLRDQLVGHGYRIFDLLGFEVSESDAWAASAPETGVFDYIAAHPGNGDDVAIVTSVLSRSFAAERLDLSAHGMPELLGRVETVASQTALITEPIETDNATDQLETTFIAGPSSPQGAIWPGGAAGVGRFMLAWKGDDHGLLFDHSDSSVIEADGRLIPVDTDGMADVLDPGHEVEIELDLSGVTATKNHQTIVELHLPGSQTTGLCRIHKNGKLEVLWIRDDKTLQVDGAIFSPGRTTISVGRSRTGWHLGGRGSSGTITVTMPGTSDELLDLAIGRRRFWSNPERVDALELPLRITHGAQGPTSRARVGVGTAKQRAKSLLGRNPLVKTAVKSLRAALKGPT